MARPIRIALDAMGGDHGPAPLIAGALHAARHFGYDILLVGNPGILNAELDRLQPGPLPVRIIPSDSVVEMHESPAQACRAKPSSSIMSAARLVSEHQADAVVSAGNSGATMAAALWHMKRLPGVSRPAIITLFPTLKGFCALADAGANVDCKPKHLLQFAIMGAQMMKSVFSRPNPRVGILSIGEEPGKGNELSLASADLLRQHVPHFIGNVEGRDIPMGMADVVVCDGFVGNIVLKFGEGLSEALVTLIKEGIKAHPIARLGGLMLRGALKSVKKRTDYAEYGGAPLVGVNGVAIICHGKSNSKAIFNAIRVAGEFVLNDTNHLIQQELARHHADVAAPEEPPHVHLTV